MQYPSVSILVCASIRFQLHYAYLIRFHMYQILFTLRLLDDVQITPCVSNNLPMTLRVPREVSVTIFVSGKFQSHHAYPIRFQSYTLHKHHGQTLLSHYNGFSIQPSSRPSWCDDATLPSEFIPIFILIKHVVRSLHLASVMFASFQNLNLRPRALLDQHEPKHPESVIDAKRRRPWQRVLPVMSRNTEV